ncbi:MAG: two-component system sensor histidine kinase NtrB [Armatimonadota bacterium]
MSEARASELDVTVQGEILLGRDAEADQALPLLNAAKKMVLLLESNSWRVVSLNQAMSDAVGKPISQVVGTCIFDHFSHPQSNKRREVCRAVLQEREPITFVDHHQGRQLLSFISPMLDPAGDVPYVAVVIQDLTDLKRAAETQRLAALGRLSAGVAHEFNNLMAAQLLAARMIQARDLDPEITELVNLIVRSTISGRDICANLLSFAQCHKARRTLISIEEPIEAALELCHQHLDKAQVAVKRKFGPCQKLIVGDVGQLQHVFLNLFLNACQAMSEGGELIVETGRKRNRKPHQITVTVSDTGTGINQADLPLLFEPFFTTKGPAQSEDPGTGLGLAVCHGIVKGHGGTISAKNRATGGAKFTLRFPESAEAPVAIPAVSATEPPSKARRLHGRILVAEDQPDMLKLLSRLLVADGCDVVLCNRTGAAVEALQAQEFDAVVTDLLMPEGGGLRLLEETLQLQHPPPVLLITGSTDASLAGDLLARGAAACLLKPFELSEFRQTLAELLCDRMGS